MPSSVINGAIGKSPLIDKVNQLAERETRVRANEQMAQYVCGSDTVKYPSVPISFPECRKEMKKQMSRLGKERQGKR